VHYLGSFAVRVQGEEVVPLRRVREWLGRVEGKLARGWLGG
jgi:hypothetical protein